MSKALPAAVAAAVLVLGAATAEAAHVEGYVACDANQSDCLNVGDVPLAGVRVVVTGDTGTFDGVTDANGFYQFEIDEFLGFPATIEVACETARREIRGIGSAVLREGLIRRDVYLGANRRISRCRPMETQ